MQVRRHFCARRVSTNRHERSFESFPTSSTSFTSRAANTPRQTLVTSTSPSLWQFLSLTRPSPEHPFRPTLLGQCRPSASHSDTWPPVQRPSLGDSRTATALLPQRTILPRRCAHGRCRFWTALRPYHGSARISTPPLKPRNLTAGFADPHCILPPSGASKTTDPK